jgi:hypothetical protein
LLKTSTNFEQRGAYYLSGSVSYAFLQCDLECSQGEWTHIGRDATQLAGFLGHPDRVGSKHKDHRIFASSDAALARGAMAA